MTADEKQINIGNAEKCAGRQHQSLSKKVIYSGGWVFAMRLGGRALGFVRTIILARLLAPEDFGLLGIAMLAILILDTFTQTGFYAALVQQKKDVKPYLDTAWTVSVIRGTVLCLILFLSAPLVADFFNSPGAETVIKILAATTLLTGFRNSGIVFFQKELEYKKQFIYQFSGTIGDFIVSVILAFVLRNVWALVWGGLAAAGIRLVMSYVVHPYRPRFVLEAGKIKEMFTFGRWVTVSGILVFFVTQGDDIFVGRMISAAALGLYQMAFLLSNLPATEITNALSKVTFPAYSKIGNDLARIKKAYLEVLQITSFTAMPLAGGIFILAYEFVEIFLGAKWLPIVPAMQVLVAAGIVRAIMATAGPVFDGIGRPDINTKLQAIRLTIMLLLIFPFVKWWGIFGAAMAVLISTVAAGAGFCQKVISVTQCGIYRFCRMIIFPATNGFMMVLVIALIKTGFTKIELPQFILLACSGSASYLFIAFLLDRYGNYGIIKLVREKAGVLR